MESQGVTACLLTSMHNIAYYSGFLYCAFGRPYGLVVTASDSVVISAGIDAGSRGGGPMATRSPIPTGRATTTGARCGRSPGPGKAIGYEADHLTLVQKARLDAFLSPPQRTVDIAPATMRADAQITRRDRPDPGRAETADVGGYAIRDAIREGAREIDVAMAGRDAMELEIARRFPEAEYRDTWVWFQSGINTDGAHNPVTGRRLQRGDILSLNTFPMISGYYTALERTLFVGEVDAASRAIWEANVATHEWA
jgi:creatinase